MTGTQSGNGFQLTRSDITATVLTFPLEPASPRFRVTPSSSVQTNLTLATAGTMGKLTIGTNAVVLATFWQYNTGLANISLSIDSLTVDTSIYGSLRLTNLPTVKANSSSSTLTSYGTVAKSSFRTLHRQSIAK